MMTKRIFFLLFPVVLLISLFSHQSAYADSPVHFTPCDGALGMSATQVADTVRNQYPTGWIASLDWNSPDISALFGLEKLDSGDYKYVIFWNGSFSSHTLEPDTKISFASDGSSDNFSFVGSGFGGSSLVANMDGTYYSTANGNDQVASNGTLTCLSEVKNVLFDTSYTGSHFGASTNSSYMPNYNLSIVKQDISLDLLPPSGDNPPDYKYAIGLYRCADLNASYDTCDVTGDHVIYEGIQDKGPSSWTYHVLSQGHYQLYILMVKPGTTAFDEANNILDGSGFYALKVDIDGGVYTMSSEDTSSCTTSTDTGRTQMICSGSTFTTCTLNTSDVLSFIGSLPEYIPCQFTNLGKLIQSSFYILFVPSAYSMQQFQIQINNWANSHLGAFVQFSNWFGSITPSITSGASDIVCTHDFGTFFGSHFVFNQCALEQKYPQMWGVITLVVRSTAVFMVLLMIYQKIKYILGASKEVS